MRNPQAPFLMYFMKMRKLKSMAVNSVLPLMY